MFTDNSLSTAPAPSRFLGARATVTPKRIDYSDGGIAIRDPSQGLWAQVWTCEVVTHLDIDTIYVGAPNTPRFPIYVGVKITEVSLAFDLASNPCVAFVEDGVSKVRMWDSGLWDFITVPIGEGCRNPKVCVDEPRSANGIQSDVILAYIKEGALYFRMQRDIFAIEYLLDEGPFIELQRTGMGALRFQFQVLRA